MYVYICVCMYRRLETRIWNLSALRQVLRRGTGASPSLSSGRRVCSGILPAAVNLARKSISLTLIGPRSLWTSTVDPRDVSGIRFAFNFLRRMRTRRGRGIIYHASPTRLVENLSVDRPPLLGDDVDLLVGRVPLLSSPPFIYIHIYIHKVKRNRAPIIAPGGGGERKRRPV